MKRLHVCYQDRLVGELLARDGIHYFSYDADWLSNPLPLSPYELPAEPGVTGHAKGFFLTLPGLCHDSLPDRFGRTVLRRNFEALGAPNPSPLQMLSFLGNRTLGALTYRPANGEDDPPESVDLVEAARSAQRLVAHDHGDALDPAIIKAGATAGGMTPKILAAIETGAGGTAIFTGVHDIPAGAEPWLIKLNTDAQKHSSLIELEHAYFAMARVAKLRVPETRLIRDRKGRVHFAIRRFDRAQNDPNQRIHTQTYASLAGIDYREPTSDYESLLRLTKHLTRDHREVCQQFRRMVFNILAYNRDDHAKNFSFCMNEQGEWTLSPAYDLLFTDNDLGGNWMMLRGKRTGIQRGDLVTLADLVGIERNALDVMVQEVCDALRQWPQFAKESGVGTGLTKVVSASIQQMLRQL